MGREERRSYTERQQEQRGRRKDKEEENVRSQGESDERKHEELRKTERTDIVVKVQKGNVI